MPFRASDAAADRMGDPLGHLRHLEAPVEAKRTAAAERFRMIHQLKDRFPVEWLCKQLDVARRGYYS